MTFNEAVDKIMPEVHNGSKEPFIIYRDDKNEWHCDFTQNQYGETFGWVETVKYNDPFSVTFTGEDFSNASFPMVYDRVMLERLRAEYEVLPLEKITVKLEACLNFLEENIGALSRDVTDYLIRFDKPLAVINNMIPISLESPDPEHFYYNEDKAEEAIQILESKVKDIITRPIDEPFGINAEKRNIEGYEEKLSIQLAGKYVVLAENPTAVDPYFIVNLKHDNPLGLEERYDGAVTDNYLEAMREFVNRVDGLLTTLETERRESGLPFQTLTAAECIPNSKNADYEGKLLIVKADILAPEYRSAEHQLVLCTGGFGANANARGNAVFVEDLYSGKASRYERYQIEGLADPQKIPIWAVDKLLENLKKEGLSTDNVNIDEMSRREKGKAEPKKKPTIQEKLDKAKEKAREADAKNDNRSDKPKKRDERE